MVVESLEKLERLRTLADFFSCVDRYGDVMSGCYQCGSPEGTAALLCPQCIEEANSRRIEALGRAREDLYGPGGKGQQKKLLSETDICLIIGTLGALILCSWSLFAGPFKKEGILACLLFGFLLTSVSLGIFFPLFFWGQREKRRIASLCTTVTSALFVGALAFLSPTATDRVLFFYNTHQIPTDEAMLKAGFSLKCVGKRCSFQQASQRLSF